MDTVFKNINNTEQLQQLQQSYVYAKQAKDQMKSDWKAAHPKTSPLGKKIQPKGRTNAGAVPTGPVTDVDMDEDEI